MVQMAEIQLKNDNKKIYIVLLIGLIVAFGIGSLPPFLQVTEIGMRTLGVFTACILYWLFGYITWGSLLGLVLMALYVPSNNMTAILSNAYGAAVLQLVFWCLVFCYGLQRCGVLDYCAKLILSSKWSTKSPWTLAVSFWLAALVCSAITTNSAAATFMIYPIFYDVAKRLGIQPRSGYCAMVLIFITTFTAIGLVMLPYSAGLWTPVGIMMAVAPDLSIPVLKLCLVNIVLCFGTLVIAALLLKIFLATGFIKADFSMDNVSEIVNKNELQLTPQIKWGFFYIILMTLIISVPTLIKGDGLILSLINKIGTIGAFPFCVVLMCLTRVNGEPLLDLVDAMKKGVPWGIYFMLGTALLVAGAIVNGDCGISASIGAALAHLQLGNNPYILMASFLILGLVVTNCINNVVTMQLLIPIMTPLFLSLGINPVICIGLAAVLLDHGNVMPSGSPLGAYMHGNSEWNSGKQVYGYATLGSICLAISTAILALPLAMQLIS